MTPSKNNNKQSFIFHSDWYEIFKEHSDVRLEVLDATMAYAFGEELPTLSKEGGMAFSFIKKTIDRDNEKYSDKCEKMRANIKKRYEKAKGVQLNTKVGDNDNDNDNPNHNPNDNQNHNDTTTSSYINAREDNCGGAIVKNANDLTEEDVARWQSLFAKRITAITIEQVAKSNGVDIPTAARAIEMAKGELMLRHKNITDENDAMLHLQAIIRRKVEAIRREKPTKEQWRRTMMESINDK